MYSTADILRFQAGGNNVFAISNGVTYTQSLENLGNVTGRFYIYDRATTNIAPCYTFASDDDTGIGRNAANQLSAAAGAVEAQRWTDTGSTIYTDLTVVGNTTFAGLVNGCSSIASLTAVDASHTLDVAFTTQSVATHSLLSNTHNCSEIASKTAVTDLLAQCDASHTLDVAFTTQSVATHSLLSNSHNCSAIASQAYVDAQVAALGGGFIGNEYTFAGASSSNRLPINGASESIALASGTGKIIKVYVSAKISQSQQSMLWELRSAVSASNNAPFTFGASSTVFDAWGDASLYGCHIVANSDLQPGIQVIASGPDTSVWKVNKIEILGN